MEPLMVRDGDASARIATDLPRFNWLELKLSQQQHQQAKKLGNAGKVSDVVASTSKGGGGGGGSVTSCANVVKHQTAAVAAAAAAAAVVATTTTKAAVIVATPAVTMASVVVAAAATVPPLKKRCRVSDPCVDGDRRVCGIVRAAVHSDVVAADVKLLNESCTSRWPLKKRAIREQHESPGDDPVDLVPLQTMVKLDLEHDLHCRSVLSGGESTGPVIVKNLLPPTPPPSSAAVEPLPETESEGVQEKPLDLSKRIVPLEDLPVKKKKSPVDVEIISVTVRPSQQQQQQHQQQQQQHQQQLHLLHHRQQAEQNMEVRSPPYRPTAPMLPSDVNDRRGKDSSKVFSLSGAFQAVGKPKREPTRAEMPIRPVIANTFLPYSDWNRPVHNFAQFFTAAPFSTVPCSVGTVRPFPVSALRNPQLTAADRLRLEWNAALSSAPSVPQQRNVAIVRPEVSGVTSTFMPHFLRPKGALTVQAHGVGGSGKAPVVPVPTRPSVAQSTWPLRCHVCAKTAGYKCAGCQGDAYCSMSCQELDWPRHSRLCQLNS